MICLKQQNLQPGTSNETLTNLVIMTKSCLLYLEIPFYLVHFIYIVSLTSKKLIIRVKVQSLFILGISCS